MLAVSRGGPPGPASDALLFPLFARFVLDRHAADMAAFRRLVLSADMRRPHEWYGLARTMKRRLVYHAVRLRNGGGGSECSEGSRQISLAVLNVSSSLSSMRLPLFNV